MRLATIKWNDTEMAGIVAKNGILPIRALNAAKGTAWRTDMLSLIQEQQIPGLTAWYNAGGKEELESIPGLVPADQVVYAPLYRNPKRIFGIGLNYVDHAGDIGSAAPTGFPGSFFKMADTLIGPADEIKLPTLKEAQKTTAEAELGIIMGKDCRDVSEENWQDAIVGYTTILDMTEESILKGNDYVSGNPRYLCIVKNFPTFFSFGPQLVTPDEVPDVLKLEVQSVRNGEVYAKKSYVIINTKQKKGQFISYANGVLKYKYNKQEYTVNPEKLEEPALIINNRLTKSFNIDPIQIIQIRPASELERQLLGAPSAQVIIVTDKMGFLF